MGKKKERWILFWKVVLWAWVLRCILRTNIFSKTKHFSKTMKRLLLDKSRIFFRPLTMNPKHLYFLLSGSCKFLRKFQTQSKCQSPLSDPIYLSLLAPLSLLNANTENTRVRVVCVLTTQSGHFWPRQNHPTKNVEFSNTPRDVSCQTFYQLYLTNSQMRCHEPVIEKACLFFIYRVDQCLAKLGMWYHFRWYIHEFLNV